MIPRERYVITIQTRLLILTLTFIFFIIFAVARIDAVPKEVLDVTVKVEYVSRQEMDEILLSEGLFLMPQKLSCQT